MYKILIIEDEKEIREGIRILLGNDEMQFIEAENGQTGLNLLDDSIDLVILDIMMPGLNGITICEMIRKKYTVPILFLSAKSQETDKLIGLQAGADDYLTKPFSYMELNARIKSLLRRYCDYCGRGESPAELKTEYLEIDGIKISTLRNEVFLGKKEINLTELEYQILYMLIKKPNCSHSAKVLYEEIWKEPYFYGAGSTIMVHIKNLRLKIEEDPHHPSRIITVWGKGYQFRRKGSL